MDRNLCWNLTVHGCQVDPGNCGLSDVPSKIESTDLIHQLLSKIDRLRVCAGHPDQHFIEMVQAKSKKGELLSSTGTMTGYIDRAAPVDMNGQTFSVTLRSSSCQLLTPTTKCPVCVAYRDTVRSMHHRWVKKTSSTAGSSSSHVNDKFLRTPERKEKVEALKKRVRSAEKSVR